MTAVSFVKLNKTNFKRGRDRFLFNVNYFPLELQAVVRIKQKRSARFGERSRPQQYVGELRCHDCENDNSADI